jgi:uncharacterized protein YidB (DUF937 family)
VIDQRCAGQMQQLASRAGLDRRELGSELAGLLPQIVDRLTPQGRIRVGGIEDPLATLSKRAAPSRAAGQE